MLTKSATNCRFVPQRKHNDANKRGGQKFWRVLLNHDNAQTIFAANPFLRFQRFSISTCLFNSFQRWHAEGLYIFNRETHQSENGEMLIKAKNLLSSHLNRQQFSRLPIDNQPTIRYNAPHTDKQKQCTLQQVPHFCKGKRKRLDNLRGSYYPLFKKSDTLRN